MLRNTFIHVRGIGPTLERQLWHSGASTWDQFLDLCQSGSLRNPRYVRFAPFIQRSQEALRAGESEFFQRHLPARERWRLYSEFADRAAFFDIETTGLSPDYDKVTAIGLQDSQSFRTFVQGQNLDEFPEAAARYPLLVSFNGAQFDVPFLRAAFRGFEPRAHLDLRFPLARLGHRGGLKMIERSLGLSRPAGIREMDGFDAVILWNKYRRGNRAALDQLLTYLEHDVKNLVPLAEYAVRQLGAQVASSLCSKAAGTPRDGVRPGSGSGEPSSSPGEH